MCYQNLLPNFSNFLLVTERREDKAVVQVFMPMHWSIHSAKLSYTLLIGREQSFIKYLGGDFGNTFSKFRKV